ncbi:hypothetical protein MBANPS3_008405 [Mucor bainieri]
MSKPADPLMFWLEQEPATNSDDTTVFLPADTPTDNSSSRYNYQLSKRAQTRRQRVLCRLRAYEMEKITMRRRTPNARDARPRPLVKLEVIKGEEFLNSHKDDFMELFKMTEKYQRGDNITKTAVYPDSELHLEERDPSHMKALQAKTWPVIEEEREFYRLKSELPHEGRDHHVDYHAQPSPSSSTARPINNNPPLKMPNRDPRSSIADPRRPQQ